MIQVNTIGQILIDGAPSPYCIAQTPSKTIVRHYTGGAGFVELSMPSARYSLACDAPASGMPGRAQFEADFRKAIA